MALIGHVMRDEKYQLIQLILQSKIDGVRGPVCRRTSWLKNIRQWTRMTTVHLFRAAVDRIIWSNMIALLNDRRKKNTYFLFFQDVSKSRLHLQTGQFFNNTFPVR